MSFALRLFWPIYGLVSAVVLINVAQTIRRLETDKEALVQAVDAQFDEVSEWRSRYGACRELLHAETLTLCPVPRLHLDE